MLSTTEAVVEDALSRPLQAGIIVFQDKHYRVVGSLNVDTRAAKQLVANVQSHWIGVAEGRLHQETSPTWFAYNVVSVSQRDLVQVEEELEAVYREIRALVAASEPTEVAALVMLHLVPFEECAPLEVPPSRSCER